MRQLQAERAETLRMPGERFATYRCPAGHATVTAVVDGGRLPDTLGCRHPAPVCGEQATRDPGLSLAPDVPPVWEWHRPPAAQMLKIRRAGGALWAHVHAGGLILRRRRATP